MTNEEKAREIGDLCPSCLNDGINGCSECERAGKYFGALQMAEWKDQQFKELLVNKLTSVRDCYQKAKTEAKKNYYSTQMVVIAEIINELFGGE